LINKTHEPFKHGDKLQNDTHSMRINYIRLSYFLLHRTVVVVW